MDLAKKFPTEKRIVDTLLGLKEGDAKLLYRHFPALREYIASATNTDEREFDGQWDDLFLKFAHRSSPLQHDIAVRCITNGTNLANLSEVIRNVPEYRDQACGTAMRIVCATNATDASHLELLSAVVQWCPEKRLSALAWLIERDRGHDMWRRAMAHIMWCEDKAQRSWFATLLARKGMEDIAGGNQLARKLLAWAKLWMGEGVEDAFLVTSFKQASNGRVLEHYFSCIS